MDVQSIKLDLIRWLAGMQDPTVVMTFLKLREEVEKQQADPDLQPMTKEELIARAIASNEAIKNGDVYDVNELA
ncbi:MAG TPA: hypothetical protein ENJ95_09920, partial [Bacteroidetes bacterium]|nr:hypothetical protein [Bacteroidota bacterium]